MKLYYAPGACSMAAHIMLKEGGFHSDYQPVDLHTHKTKDGQDFYKINPKGYVPALVREEGDLITEATAVLYYLAQQKPSADIDPIHLLEWLSFLSTEVHKSYGPLFDPSIPADMAQALKGKLAARLKLIDHELERKHYLLGQTFTGADAYLFTMLNWSEKLKVDLTPYPNIAAYIQRIAPRPSVQAAMKEEGLTKA